MEKMKFTFPQEVRIIPTRGGFVPMMMKKNGKMEIYISLRSLDYTNTPGGFAPYSSPLSSRPRDNYHRLFRIKV